MASNNLINIYIGAFNRMSLRGTRLLGRWRWVPVNLSWSHIHYQDTISIGCGSDRSKRLRQFPLSRDPLHREPLFAKSASSHGSDISGIFFNCSINYFLSIIVISANYNQGIRRFSPFLARNWWQNFSSNPTSVKIRNCLHLRSFVIEFW